jgi:hypothetical protein
MRICFTLFVKELIVGLLSGRDPTRLRRGILAETLDAGNDSTAPVASAWHGSKAVFAEEVEAHEAVQEFLDLPGLVKGCGIDPAHFIRSSDVWWAWLSQEVLPVPLVCLGGEVYLKRSRSGTSGEGSSNPPAARTGRERAKRPSESSPLSPSRREIPPNKGATGINGVFGEITSCGREGREMVGLGSGIREIA